MTSRDSRHTLTSARRVVVKVGSSAIVDSGARHLAREIASISSHKPPREITIVSSGAIALGITKLGLKKRPTTIGLLQACAAAGQSLLMSSYEEAFQNEGLRVAQVLLTHADLADRSRANNARAAIGELVKRGVIPIINENDTVAVEEIRFGDNDQLAAMVTGLLGADLLVLLSNVDGILDRSGSVVHTFARPDEAEALLRSERSAHGTGGMSSKLLAAGLATRSGAHVIVASGQRRGVLSALLGGGTLGSHFLAAPRALRAKKAWVLAVLRPKGVVTVDAGAERAIVGGRASVLLVGVTGIRGTFSAGDAVSIQNASGMELGRGLARVSAAEAAALAKVRQNPPTLLVHRDDLVVLADAQGTGRSKNNTHEES